MSKTLHIVGIVTGVVITITFLCVAVWYGEAMSPKEAPCKAVNYIIADSEERQYVTPAELNKTLQDVGLFPLGQAVKTIPMQQIEWTIKNHPMVRTAECYLTPRNEMMIRLTQRVPLLKVQNPGDAYFIDTDCKVMEARAVVKDPVLLVKGAVGVQTARTQMADFAQWLQKDVYWRDKVDYVTLQSPQMAYVHLKGSHTPRIAIGSMNDFERKLRKAKRFLDQEEELTQGKHYTELDVRFKGQIIGR